MRRQARQLGYQYIFRQRPPDGPEEIPCHGLGRTVEHGAAPQAHSQRQGHEAQQAMVAGVVAEHLKAAWQEDVLAIGERFSLWEAIPRRHITEARGEPIGSRSGVAWEQRPGLTQAGPHQHAEPTVDSHQLHTWRSPRWTMAQPQGPHRGGDMLRCMQNDVFGFGHGLYPATAAPWQSVP